LLFGISTRVCASASAGIRPSINANTQAAERRA
jgi:hypothetical protein